MAGRYEDIPETDLDKTDRLPMLPGTLIDGDVADDAVPLEGAAQEPHQESGAPSRAYQRAREAAGASVARAEALAADLKETRAALDAEQARAREWERLSAERSGDADVARSRIEEALREAERFRGESRGLREALAARDASIAKLQHSLAERDAQLSALQQEHAKVVPALEATAQSSSQLEADLQAARAHANTLSAELEAGRRAADALATKLERSESEINATRYDLGAAKMQAGTYLDVLRTREWRRGFEQNLSGERAAPVAAHPEGSAAGQAEVRRVTAELQMKSAANAQIAEENRTLRAALERSREAVEERDALIRRLRSAEGADAHLSVPIPAPPPRGASIPGEAAAEGSPGTPMARTAEMIRIGGDGPVKYVLGSRTRIGRVPGCDLQIDSPSVSRYHALVHVGERDTVIEDLESTNGVLINGRKVRRHVLCDGDEVTLGESHFRYVSRPLGREGEQSPAEPGPGA